MYPDFERAALVANDRRQAIIEEARIHKLVVASRSARIAVLQSGARIIGRGLVGLGARLLRYGRSEYAVVLEQGMPAARSALLN